MSDYIINIPSRMRDVDGKDRPLTEKRFIDALFKTVCGYWNGHTMQHFMRELGFAELAKDDETGKEYNKATDLGKKFLYHYYNNKCAKAEFKFES